jgi:energy-converting hydrogenase Eha subunit G
MAIFGIITLGAAAASGIAGYLGSKDFAQKKLRFVDAAHSPAAPWIAGGIAAIVAAPVVWLLPLVGAGTAIIFGAGVGLGVKAAQRDRHLLP